MCESGSEATQRGLNGHDSEQTGRETGSHRGLSGKEIFTTGETEESGFSLLSNSSNIIRLKTWSRGEAAAAALTLNCFYCLVPHQLWTKNKEKLI